MPELSEPEKGSGRKKADRAYELLFSDLVENIMARAADPARCVEYMATELRSFVGAGTILIYECGSMTGFDIHRLISVQPQRRSGLGMDPIFQELAVMSHDWTSARHLRPDDGSPASLLLGRAYPGDSLVLPLVYGEQRVGVIFLLGLIEPSNVRSVISTLERLSAVLALILRNAHLYGNLEDEVRQRTAELERKNALLESLLREKETMLREIHHRVKNNLQIVNSLLYLRMQGIEEESIRTLFEESQNRVYAMALAHEELYRSADLSLVDMGEYITRLVDRVLDSAAVRVARSFRLDPLSLGPDEAIPCGLVVDELVMNAIKHAFSGRDLGSLEVTLKNEAGMVSIMVADDGPGIDPVLFEGGSGGLGLTIIRGLTGQLRGEVILEPGPGARFVMRFPLAREPQK